jgi:hypothetical protein
MGAGAGKKKNWPPLRLLNTKDLRVEFLQRAAKNLALPAQGKLRGGSRSEYFQGKVRFFVAAAP